MPPRPTRRRPDRHAGGPAGPLAAPGPETTGRRQPTSTPPGKLRLDAQPAGLAGGGGSPPGPPRTRTALSTRPVCWVVNDHQPRATNEAVATRWIARIQRFSVACAPSLRGGGSRSKPPTSVTGPLGNSTPCPACGILFSAAPALIAGVRCVPPRSNRSMKRTEGLEPPNALVISRASAHVLVL